MIKFSNVQLGYGRRSVLNDLNFEIQKGDFFGIVGPNGAGKTTLLKAILGLLKPIKGKIHFLNNGRGHKKNIGYVPQHASVDELFPVTVLDMVLMGRYAKMGIFKRPKSNDYSIAEKMMKNVGMENLAKRNYRELSGGQKQRTLIARAMAGEPNILILDEPVEGMDVQGEIVIMELIKILHAEYALTVILVCHDLNIIANYVKTLSIIHNNTLKLGPVESILNEETMANVYGTQVKIVDIDGQKAIISKLNE
ncbi:MAG: metal ABC transporter ATP-binding protein [Candidatus Scalindua rubra]|uniref:Bacterial ABC transporter cassette n=1 Tax=Candidatus Scalindua brodae TaxID=237368 RepID=A0A0B0ECY9_9BACT|nr:MAG: bacterial ABC transporter cassette [Candidatus Scalindua brodae]MBZ0110656.1 metal ABC transporter ATP-binding protein [Candidatus Scalindua rubra]TWU28923.1 High-affinity zinc uptake system ATP-binding protein ZnuC [Candidatus Brocadiaceae bacterium S225]